MQSLRSCSTLSHQRQATGVPSSMRSTPRSTRAATVGGTQASVRRGVVVCGLGKDAMDGFMDVTKLVAGSGGSKTPYEEFASAIGRDIYVDIAGWHLYLRDMGTGVPGASMKMNQALAAQFGPQLNKGLREADVEDLLRKIPVKLGAGKLKASLFDVMPSMCVGDMVRLCEDFARR